MNPLKLGWRRDVIPAKNPGERQHDFFRKMKGSRDRHEITLITYIFRLSEELPRARFPLVFSEIKRDSTSFF
jgi:hypothetical protein